MKLKDQIDDILKKMESGNDDSKGAADDNGTAAKDKQVDTGTGADDKVTEPDKATKGGDADKSAQSYDQDDALDIVRSTIADLFGAVSQSQSNQAQTTGKETKVPSIDDISDEELEEAMTSPVKLKALLKKHTDIVMTNAMSKILDKVYNTVMEQVQASMLVSSFYNKHPELEPYKEFVNYYARLIAEAKPQLPADKVMEAAGTMVADKLRLGKKERKPFKATATTTQAKGQELTEQEKEILDLIT